MIIPGRKSITDVPNTQSGKSKPNQYQNKDFAKPNRGLGMHRSIPYLNKSPMNKIA